MGTVEKMRLRKWTASRGFGFARPCDAGQERDRDVFVHARVLDADLIEFSRTDHPRYGDDGKPDYKATQWPFVWVEWDEGERGRTALRVATTEFVAGTRAAGAAVPVLTTAPGDRVFRAPDAMPASSRFGAAPRKGPQEGVRRPKSRREGQRGFDVGDTDD